jgi:dihydropteroate synthase
MKIFGILNLTEDSFSDGGKYIDIQDSISKIDSLVVDGVDVIDVGAQSSNIHSKIIHPVEEWNRLEPVLHYLKNKKIPISVDTYKSEIISKCLEIGVDFINNIKSFEDNDSFIVLQNNHKNVKNLILMYSHSHTDKAIPNSSLKINTIIDTISFYFDNKINKLIDIGIELKSITIDPGMGLFLGDDPELSFEVLRKIDIFQKRFPKVMVSISRKSFLGNILGGIPPNERKEATLAGEIYLYSKKIDFIRTHDVLQLKQSMIIWDKLQER